MLRYGLNKPGFNNAVITIMTDSYRLGYLFILIMSTVWPTWNSIHDQTWIITDIKSIHVDIFWVVLNIYNDWNLSYLLLSEPSFGKSTRWHQDIFPLPVGWISCTNATLLYLSFILCDTFMISMVTNLCMFILTAVTEWKVWTTSSENKWDDINKSFVIKIDTLFGSQCLQFGTSILHLEWWNTSKMWILMWIVSAISCNNRYSFSRL